VGFTWAPTTHHTYPETDMVSTGVLDEVTPAAVPQPEAPPPSTIDQESDSSDSESSDTPQQPDLPSQHQQSLDEFCATDGQEPTEPTPKQAKYDAPSVIWYAGHRQSTPSSTSVSNPSTTLTPSSVRESNQPIHDSIEVYLDRRITIAEHRILDEVDGAISGLEHRLTQIIEKINPYPFNATF